MRRSVKRDEEQDGGSAGSEPDTRYAHFDPWASVDSWCAKRGLSLPSAKNGKGTNGRHSAAANGAARSRIDWGDIDALLEKYNLARRVRMLPKDEFPVRVYIHTIGNSQDVRREFKGKTLDDVVQPLRDYCRSFERRK